METAPLALLLSRAAVLHEVNSARPWAPVEEPRERRRPRVGRAPRSRRGRAALASALHRAADALAPAPAPDVCSPAR